MDKQKDKIERIDQVYDAQLLIPPGEVLLSQIARLIGHPRAARGSGDILRQMQIQLLFRITGSCDPMAALVVMLL